MGRQTEGPPSRGATGDWFVPRVLNDRYVLLDVLGQGGAGTVFRAFDRELGRNLAVKLLHSQHDEGASTRSIRLKREARAIASLQHPNVVSVYDVAAYEDGLFITMEYVEGSSLRDWLAQHPSIDAIIETFEQAGQGLFAAHRAGIVHRDFKPANVLVGTDGRVRVVDFGVARSASVAAPTAETPVPETPGLSGGTLTKTGGIIGTPAYMAPEQIRAEQVDSRADQYSFCLSLAEALLGERAPWRRSLIDAVAVDPATIRAWLKGRGIPAPLRSDLERGLSMSPTERFDSMEPLLARLTRLRGRRRRSIERFLTVSAVGVAGLVALGVNLRPGPCHGFESSVNRVWSTQDAVTLTEAMARRGLSSEIQREVTGGLDRYAADWLRWRTEVCEATNVRGEQSERLLDVRMHCLDRRLADFGSLVSLLKARPPFSPEAVTDAVLRLPEPGPCTRMAATGSARAASNPDLQPRIEAMEAAFSELSARYAAGLVEEGLRLAGDARSRADELDVAAVSAESYDWLARFHAALDQRQPASEAWHRAIAHADAAADDGRRLGAYLELIRLDQGTRDTAERTDRAVEQAEALLVRLGDDARSRAAVLSTRARLALRRGRFLECRTLGEEAMALTRDAARVSLAERLRVEEDLASCLEQLGLRRRAARVIEASLRTATAKLGPDHPRVGRLWAELSRAKDFSGDPVGAERAAEEALRIARSTLGDSHSQTARAWQVLGNVHFRSRAYEAAVSCYEQSESIHRGLFGPDSHQVAGLLTSRALSLSKLGRYEASDELHARAVERFSAALGPRHPDTGAAIGRRGANLQDRGDCDAAVPYLRRAKAILKDADPQHARILDQIRGLAGCLLSMGRNEEALEELQEGLRLSQVRDEAPYFTGLLYFQAAQAYWRTDEDRSRAVELARTSLDWLEEDGQDDAFIADVQRWVQARTGPVTSPASTAP